MGVCLVGQGTPAPPLNDIPGMLRRIADDLEKDQGAVPPDDIPSTLIILRLYPDDTMTTGMIGAALNKRELMGALHLAANEFLPGSGRLLRESPLSPDTAG